MIAIVDYGVGNLRSVERALLHVGAKPKLTADQDELQHADGMVLPGVGAFAPALAKLSEGGLGRRVVELAKKGNQCSACASVISCCSRSRWSTDATRAWGCSMVAWSR